MPRIISAAEWRLLERGIEQRVRALNAFLYDIYHRQEIIRAGRIPADLVLGNAAYLPEMIGHDPPLNVYSHIIGVDIVRVSENEFYVLEDNLRTPSGVSYMLENRETMMHLFPELFASHRVAPIGQISGDCCCRTLQAVAPPACEGDPKVAVLTPGIHNSAFFEHSFLADQMGVELVEGQDLFVEDGYLYMRTTQGRERLDVIYRRIDDNFLDPLTFHSGLHAWRAGADGPLSRRPRDDRQRAGRRHRRRQGGLHLRSRDHPVLHRAASDPAERADLALLYPGRAVACARASSGTGGEGGARLRRLRDAGRADRQQEARSSFFARSSKSRPAKYIAQPTLALSTCPSVTQSGIAPRHVDLRPYVLVAIVCASCPAG